MDNERSHAVIQRSPVEDATHKCDNGNVADSDVKAESNQGDSLSDFGLEALDAYDTSKSLSGHQSYENEEEIRLFVKEDLPDLTEENTNSLHFQTSVTENDIHLDKDVKLEVDFTLENDITLKDDLTLEGDIAINSKQPEDLDLLAEDLVAQDLHGEDLLAEDLLADKLVTNESDTDNKEQNSFVLDTTSSLEAAVVDDDETAALNDYLNIRKETLDIHQSRSTEADDEDLKEADTSALNEFEAYVADDDDSIPQFQANREISEDQDQISSNEENELQETEKLSWEQSGSSCFPSVTEDKDIRDDTDLPHPPPSEAKSLKTKHGIRIKVYVGDITKANADAVVTGDSPLLSDMSMVTRALCRAPGGEEFLEKRERRRSMQRILRNGRVYTVHIKNQEFPFQYVFQAILNPYDPNWINPEDWAKLLRRVYKNIYKKADEKDLRSVAVPLLGTGRGQGSPEESVESAARTLCRYSPVSLEEVQFVSLDRDINDYIAVICESLCSISDNASSEDDETDDEDEMDDTNHTVSAFANLSSNDYISPPPLLHEPAGEMSSAFASNFDKSSDSSPQMTRAEHLQQLLSRVRSKPKAETEDDDVNYIPEVHSSYAFSNSKTNSQTNEDLGETDIFQKYKEAVDKSRESVQSSQTYRHQKQNFRKEGNTRYPRYGDFPGIPRRRNWGSGASPYGWSSGLEFDKAAQYGSDEEREELEEENDFEINIDADLVQTGNQPPGTMSVSTLDDMNLPGYDDVGTIVITYDIPSGVQTEDHPNPGKRYHGIRRRAYLPNNEAGKMVLRMMKIAFQRRLVFTVGRSLTTGQSDVVRWGPVSHKTSQMGGPKVYGYPDPGYLDQVTNELLNLGIVDDTGDAADDMNSLLQDYTKTTGDT